MSKLFVAQLFPTQRMNSTRATVLVTFHHLFWARITLGKDAILFEFTSVGTVAVITATTRHFKEENLGEEGTRKKLRKTDKR